MTSSAERLRIVAAACSCPSERHSGLEIERDNRLRARVQQVRSPSPDRLRSLRPLVFVASRAPFSPRIMTLAQNPRGVRLRIVASACSCSSERQVTNPSPYRSVLHSGSYLTKVKKKKDRGGGLLLLERETTGYEPVERERERERERST